MKIMIAVLIFSSLSMFAQTNATEAVSADVATCRDLLLRYVHGKDRHFPDKIHTLPKDQYVALLESLLADEYSKYTVIADKKSREAESHLGASYMLIELGQGNLAFLDRVGKNVPGLRPVVWGMYVDKACFDGPLEVVFEIIRDPEKSRYLSARDLYRQLSDRLQIRNALEKKRGDIGLLCLFLLDGMMDESNKHLSFSRFYDVQFCEVIPGYDNSIQRQVLVRRRLASLPDDVALREKFRPALDHFERLPKDRLIDLGERLGDLPKLKAAHD